MCGIAGIISLGAHLDEKDMTQTRAMTYNLLHRGPDSTGFFTSPKCCIGNTRLNIIDLSNNARLPMANENASVCMAYNGEVTNYKRLRRNFVLDENYKFHSSSDTEVVLHLYEELGIDCLKYLSGMFAFCIVDKKHAKAYIARDQYGMRPLFYMHKNQRLYFSSELKSFPEVDCFSKKPDYEGLYHYFSLAYIPGEHTPYEDVKELQGGCYLQIDLDTGNLTKHQYYNLEYRPDNKMSEQDCAVRLNEVLTDAVNRNLISDAPLGMTLSGGFDTSTILGLTHQLGKSENMHTFALKINEPSFDESRFQQLMSEHSGTIHHEITVNPKDIPEYLEQHMAFVDEPLGDGSAIPFYMLAKEASKYVKVLLSGEGGDEIFNAYETHGAYKARQLYRRMVPSPARALLRMAGKALPSSYTKLPFDFLFNRFTNGAELDIPRAHHYWRHVLSTEEKAQLLPNHCDFEPTENLFAKMFYDLPADMDNLDKLSYLDIKYFFIGDLMVKNDRPMMSSSIEARFPYMDKNVLDFVTTIPARYRIKGLKRRYIQKKAMQDILPPQILNRSNMGIEMPHSLWFVNSIRDYIEPFFAPEKVSRLGFLNPDFVQKLWLDHLNYKRDNGRALWCILMLIVWFDLYVDSNNFRQYLHPHPQID